MRIHRGTVVGLVSAIALPVLWLTPRASSQTTLSELQAALQQETNDNIRYLCSARQADGEGAAEVAGLFRAIARAEAIHAETHAAMIRKLGTPARPVPDAASCGTTEENLQAAIANEDQQQHRTYPALVHRAKQERRAGMAERIQRVRDAEGQHGAMLRLALTNLWLSKSSGQRYYYVCPDCGLVTEEITFDKCPVCFASGEKFEMIS